MAQLNYNEFERQIQSGRLELPPVIAIAGGQDFLRQNAMSLLKAYLNKQNYTIERFDDTERSADDLIRSLRTSSLFGDRLAIVVRSQRIGNRQEIIARFKDQLVDYCDQPSRSNLLLVDGKTWNGNMSFPRRVKKDFLVIDCPEFKPWQHAEIEGFMQARAQVHGLEIEGRLISELRDICSGNLALVERELEKLSLVVGGRPVTRTDLEQHLKYHGESNAFELCDAILEGKTPKALELMTKVVRNTDPGPILQLLGLIGMQVRKVAKLAYLLRSGASPASALGKAGFNPRSPKAQVWTKTAQGLTEKKIKELLSTLLKADVELKRSAPDPMASVATLVTKLSALFDSRGSSKQNYSPRRSPRARTLNA